MSISSRIHDTVENWVVEWRDRLRGWMASWVMGGIESFMDDMEPGLREDIKPSLQRLRDIPGLPEDMKVLIDKTIAEPGAIHFLALVPYLVGILMGLGMGAARPVSNIGAYQIDNLVRSARLDPLTAIRSYWRGFITEARLKDALKDQGWSDDDITALQEVTKFIPTADEQTLWLAREVYEPDMITTYGLDDELPEYEETDFAKIGVTREQMINKWRAHWLHASWMQMVEMLHRGLVTEADVKEWFRMVEMVPHWRDLLIQTAYTWPTRVDVRRWWDMRTIDETELRRLYSGMGYRGVNLDNYVLWTKVYVAFPDLIARWTKGWITEDDVREELTALGMPYDRVTEMIQTKKKAVEAGLVEEGKALTKSEIYKGVREERITRDQAIDLLMDLNYNLAQAEYLLDVNVAVAAGSPETYEEYKDLTTKYKIAIGKAERPMTEELKTAAEEVVRLTGEVEALERSIAEEKRGLVEEEVLPEETTKRLKKLQVTKNRAIAELERAKTEYNSKLAEWRIG